MQDPLGQRLKTKKMIGLWLLLRKKILNRGFYTLEREHLSDLGEVMSIDKDGDGDYDLVPKDVKVFCCLPSQYDFVSDLYWENVGGRYVRRINN